MKVLLFCCKGFEMMEFAPFVDVMGWARHDLGLDLQVVTCGLQRQVVSTFSVPVVMDTVLEELVPEEYDALALPGGFEEYGFYEEAYDGRVSELIQLFDRQQKPIASVCVGALALGKSGILVGRRATTYHLNDGHRQKQLSKFGAHVVNQPVVVDGNVITSYCPETAAHVAFRLLDQLTDETVTDQIRCSMGY